MGTGGAGNDLAVPYRGPDQAKATRVRVAFAIVQGDARNSALAARSRVTKSLT